MINYFFRQSSSLSSLLAGCLRSKLWASNTTEPSLYQLLEFVEAQALDIYLNVHRFKDDVRLLDYYISTLKSIELILEIVKKTKKSSECYMLVKAMSSRLDLIRKALFCHK